MIHVSKVVHDDDSRNLVIRRGTWRITAVVVLGEILGDELDASNVFGATVLVRLDVLSKRKLVTSQNEQGKSLVPRCSNLTKTTNGSWRILVLERSPEKNLASKGTWSRGLGVEQGSKANEGRGGRCCSCQEAKQGDDDLEAAL